MASFTLRRPDVFPNGTTVTVYPRPNTGVPASGAPSTSSVTSGAVSSDAVTFTGLTDGARYIAYAGSPDRYVSFFAQPGTSPVSPNVQTGNYSLALSDVGNAVEVSSASNLTVTVPAEATVAFPIGSVVEVGRYGTGTVTIAAAGGVTLRSPGAALGLRAQYSTATLRKRAADDWSVAGDLA